MLTTRLVSASQSGWQVRTEEPESRNQEGSCFAIVRLENDTLKVGLVPRPQEGALHGLRLLVPGFWLLYFSLPLGNEILIGSPHPNSRIVLNAIF